MYRNIREMLEVAQSYNSTLSRAIIENEIQHSGYSEEEILKLMRIRYEVMQESAGKALEEATSPEGNLISGIAHTQYIYAGVGSTICGEFINKLMARALSSSEVNAAMGKICAMPTAGSCGIVPAVLISVGERFEKSEREILMAMLTASGLGAIVTENATVAGAEGGCQAECGVAAAMAAAAAVEMMGGTAEQAVSAFTIAIMNVLGLVCDPIGGLVQVPCAHRNASQAVNAIISADMAIAGVRSYISADDAVDALYKVGKQLPVALRETALGGVAATPSAAELIEKMKEK